MQLASVDVTVVLSCYPTHLAMVHLCFSGSSIFSLKLPKALFINLPWSLDILYIIYEWIFSNKTYWSWRKFCCMKINDTRVHSIEPLWGPHKIHFLPLNIWGKIYFYLVDYESTFSTKLHPHMQSFCIPKHTVLYYYDGTFLI